MAKKLGYEYFSMGDLRGQMAIEKRMTIDELNALGEKEDWTDRRADEIQTQMGKEKDNFIFEGRLSWYFIPNSFKIFLTVDVKTAAERTLKNRAERQDEKQVASTFEAEQAVLQRLASDKKRYLQYYGIDYTKLENYDITIDTTNLKIDEIAQIILDKIKAKV
ncbi:MAG: Cytidylate kinase [Candidatus Magasanikbacteria bacterium GW2011_GWC2_41_17]|uniref:Cytidylate kinase n=1 Tax=Candidatus Magasanikbacteria bacterium GW2011_GWC2_41_17 TaxID=1619048 RepID=A0A0G0VBZ7_9BACT|nr:MAG: Cytidylate kinase [Candidatus Magasanikbacteria bacterium GW2011_GWC2_41_17]